MRTTHNYHENWATTNCNDFTVFKTYILPQLVILNYWHALKQIHLHLNKYWIIQCIVNPGKNASQKFLEEINNSSPPNQSASILHNTGKPLKYMHTPCLYHQIKRDSVEILDVTDQNNSRSSDSLLYDVFLLQTSGDILQLHFLFVNELLLPFYNLSPVAATAWNKGKQENYNHNIWDIYLTITKILSNFMHHKTIQVSHISESRCFIDSQNLCPIVPWI